MRRISGGRYLTQTFSSTPGRFGRAGGLSVSQQPHGRSPDTGGTAEAEHPRSHHGKSSTQITLHGQRTVSDRLEIGLPATPHIADEAIVAPQRLQVLVERRRVLLKEISILVQVCFPALSISPGGCVSNSTLSTRRRLDIYRDLPARDTLFSPGVFSEPPVSLVRAEDRPRTGTGATSTRRARA